jgi:hypothetical protein
LIVDSHVHLQPHGEQPPVDRARIDLYLDHARRNGVDVIVFTEHLFRFREAWDLLYGWWDADPDPTLAALTRKYWQDHVNLSLAEYVRVIEDAKSKGLPVRLGMEMDWIPGRAGDLRALLAPGTASSAPCTGSAPSASTRKHSCPSGRSGSLPTSGMSTASSSKTSPTRAWSTSSPIPT